MAYGKCSLFIAKELSIKDVRSQGKGICPVRTYFGQEGGGYSDADVCTFCCKKHRIFRIARTRGRVVEPVRIFCGRGDHFVRTFFMDDPKQKILTKK